MAEKVLVQHFSPRRCPNTSVSLDTSMRAPLGWNATIQVQKPSKIIWEKVPTSTMAELDLGATLHSPEVPITRAGPDTSMRAPLGMDVTTQVQKPLKII
jgi:hypothetical protein